MEISLSFGAKVSRLGDMRDNLLASRKKPSAAPIFAVMNISPSRLGLRRATIRRTVFPVWFEAYNAGY